MTTNERGNEMNTTAQKYFAIWQINGTQTIVLPKGKKRMSFDTVENALSALEARARRVNVDSRGIVKNIAGEMVSSIAL